MSSTDKTTAWTPIETGDPAREHHLKKAYLLCQRGKFDEAERLLKMLLVSSPNDPDARLLLARIAATEHAEKQEDEGRRAWRYRLGLQTTWSRVCWYLGALAAAGYGVWNAAQAVEIGRHMGFGAVITTMLSRGGGRSGPAYFVPWTRPVYYDLVYALAIMIVAIIVTVLVWRLSRGAALWEELGDMPRSR
jgi:hypothetical protein